MTADAVAVARQFLSAILWGEHQQVWEMLSTAGREHVLEAGARRGLDPMQAQRIRLGTSPLEERDSFLTGLVHGLRVDFASVTLQDVQPTGDPIPLPGGSFEIQLECPATFGAGAWAAGSLIVSTAEDEWRVDRVYPLVSRSE